MRIGICVRTWGEGGGIGVYTRTLLQTMLPLGTGHQWVLFYHNKAHLGQFATLPNVKEIAVHAPTKFLWDQATIPYHAARERIDVLFHPKLTVPLATRCKTVMVLHGSERFVYPQFSHKSDMLYFKTIYPLFLRRASAVISVSDNARKDVIHFLKLPPEKVHTIHLAPSDYFRKIDDDTLLAAIREKYHLPERFILNVGLIYPGKNIPNLLKALKKVRQSVDIKLVLAGTGRRMYQSDLAMIHELGLQEHVILPGYIPHNDLIGVYNLAEMVAFPSFYESFPAIPLEANACGCPVVTSATGGTPEAAGDAALYVDPTDVDGMARTIQYVLTDTTVRDHLIKKGFQNVKHFSWEKTAHQTLKVLESLGKPEEHPVVRHAYPSNR
jgi:glycosyltransferase involved in cell wall biosynthesis